HSSSSGFWYELFKILGVTLKLSIHTQAVDGQKLLSRTYRGSYNCGDELLPTPPEPYWIPPARGYLRSQLQKAVPQP
ncbi:hypothetical protein EMPG_16964, partial [Blastomyces silverae]